jgi:hypothetical protein
MDYVRLTCLVALLPLLPAWAKDNALKIYPIPVNTAADEDEPFVADNGLTLYFCSTARTGKEDFMIATRRVAGGAWGRPQLLDAWIVTEGNDRGVFTAGGPYPQYIFYATTKDKETKNYDLYVAAKDERGKAWSAVRPVANVNTREDELHPCVSASGRTLFFSRKTKDGWKQMMAPRTETKGPGGWQEPTEVGLPVGFHHAALMPDGKTMYLQGPVGKDRWGLFVAHAEGKGWSKPEELTGLNAESGKVGTRSPSLSRDGRYLYFASDRDGGKGGMDLYYIPIADLTKK